MLDYISAAAICATHLSRLGADIVLWSNEVSGFCEVGDAWTSSSSIVPPKAPVAAELLRAKSPRLAAHLTALHGVLHGLPLNDTKGMQEAAEHLFDAVDTLELTLTAAREMMASVTVRRDRMPAGASSEPPVTAGIAVEAQLDLARAALSP